MTAQPFITCDADFEFTSNLRQTVQNQSPKLNPSSSDVAKTAGWFQGLSIPHSVGNSVIPYIYGVCAFADIGDALATATDENHRIYLAGWWVDPYTRLKTTPGSLLSNYLSSTKAAVRGMFWDDPGGQSTLGPPKVADNVPIVTLLNGLAHGAAILDSKLPFLLLGGQQTGIRGGVHHQKLLVVSGSSGLIAFIGGMDINNDRTEVSNGGWKPIHDVHLRIIGPAAIEVLKVFRDRWMDHPDSAQLDRKKFNLVAYEVGKDFDAVARAPANPNFPTSTHHLKRKNDTFHAAAVGRTFANLRKFNSATNKESYAFAPVGQETSWSLVRAGVQNAKEFIYIEDQYFVSRRLKAELVKKLQQPGFKFLLVLTQSSWAFEKDPDLRKNEFPYLVAARNEIKADLLAVDQKQAKWRIFCLKASSDPERQKLCGSYVHSKTMIFDDDFAIVGSTNADDRGYTFDTEIAAGVTDDPFGRASSQSFARSLRIALWHKHLGVSHNALVSWSKGINFWLSPQSQLQAMVMNCSALEDSVLLGATPILKNFRMANNLWREDIDPDADLIP
jgi:phosphatidylserine/phosphatidylglycerophosphate/cardiolipin synthase-like enzyme